MKSFYLCKHIQRIIVFFLFVFLTSSSLKGQKLPTINTGNLKINGKAYKGYEADLPYQKKTIRNYFWKYSKDFGIPRNQRSHYELKITTGNKESEKEFIILAQALAVPKKTIFIMALNNEGIEEKSITKYNEEVKYLLTEFVRYVTHEEIENNIKEVKKQLRQLAKKYRKMSKKQVDKALKTKVINDIARLENKLEILQRDKLNLEY